MTKLARWGFALAALCVAQGAMAQHMSSSSRGTNSSIDAPQAVPEPSSMPLVILGLVGVVAVGRFIKRK